MTNESLTTTPFAAADYGSDPNGLVCGYLFRPGTGGEPIESAQAAELIAQSAGAADGSFIWLHFNLAHAGSEPWLRAHAQPPDDFFESLRESSRSTRIERDGDTLFAVVNDVTFDFAYDATDVATLWLTLRADLVVSARRHPLRAVDRLRADVKRGESMPTPVSLLERLLRDQADELQRIVRTATDRIDDIEDELLLGKQAGYRTELSRLRRLTVRLQRLLAPEPSALFRMLANPPPWVGAADAEALRQASEEFAVVLRDIGVLQERIKLLQEEASARVADENNRSLFLLTMVTVIALPINLIAGLLGMNVGGIPLADSPRGFVGVVVVIVAVTAIVARIAIKRLGPRR
jgi:zinc transporter